MSVVAEPGFMPSVVPCLQREAEFTQLLELYRERAPKRVLEIGTYHGGTLYHWLQNATSGTKVVAVDSYTTGIDNRALYEGWMPEGVDLAVVEGDTRNPAVINLVDRLGPSYDWVFIDAGHLYDEVRHDWVTFGALATDVVCFHDILYPHVSRLWDEIAAEYETREIISDPTTEWHGIGVVFM